MALLSREQFFAVELPHRIVDVPEMGGTLRLQALSVRSRTALLDVILANEDAAAAYEADQAKSEAEREGVPPVARYDQAIAQLIFSIVDESGARMFTMDDHDAFRDLPYPLLQHLYAEFMALNSRTSITDRLEALKKTSA